MKYFSRNTYLGMWIGLLERQTLQLWGLLVSRICQHMAAELLVAAEWRQRSFLLHLPSQVLPFLPILWPGFDSVSTCSLAVIACHHIHGHFTPVIEVSASIKSPLLAYGNNYIPCWCCHSDTVTFACLGWVWTYWYHSQEQPLFLVGNCWSSIEANSMVTRHSILTIFKLVRKQSWQQYQTGME